MYKKYGALTSSSNPEELADTVKGLILSFSVVIIYGVKYFFNIDIGSGQVTEFAVVMGGAIGALWTLYGLLKKIVVAVSEKK